MLYLYLIPQVLVSTFKYLWTHGYLRTREFLTHSSKYSILKLKYPQVRIRVTRECTRALP